jgi:hypothetical protein
LLQSSKQIKHTLPKIDLLGNDPSLSCSLIIYLSKQAIPLLATVKSRSAVRWGIDGKRPIIRLTCKENLLREAEI